MCAGAKRTDVVEIAREEVVGADSVTTTHRQTRNSTTLRASNGAVVAVYVWDDILNQTCNIEVGRNLVRSTFCRHARSGVDGSLNLRGVAIGHYHNHRLSQTLGNQIVDNLSCTTHTAPSLLVATATMQEVENRIFFLTLVIACGSIHGHTTLSTNGRAVVPHITQITTHRSILVVCRIWAIDNKNITIGSTITLHCRVGGVQHRRAINHKVIGVEVGIGGGEGYAPHQVCSATHSHLTRLPRYAQRYLSSVVGTQTESYALLCQFGRHHASSAEVANLLCANGERHQEGYY